MSKTILVVDDKKELRVMVKTYLEQEGFRVATANDGQEALYVARHEKPDLIILDLMMPEMGGYDFIRAYRRGATPRSSSSPPSWRKATRCWVWNWAPTIT